MMLMRERSGLSGRRRGSQNPGIAIGSDVAAAAPGDAGDCFVVCECAPVAVNAVSIATNTHAPPRRQHMPECTLIRGPFTENRGDHTIAVAAG
jgi:hypothetical protein